MTQSCLVGISPVDQPVEGVLSHRLQQPVPRFPLTLEGHERRFDQVAEQVKHFATGSPIPGAHLPGETVPAVSAATVRSDRDRVIPVGAPPAGGPHRSTPWRTGFYDPVSDGNAVHSLEHGVVWLSYNPELVDQSGVDALRDIFDDFSRDLIVSPRPDNSDAVAIVSWGRIMGLDSVDVEQLVDFIRTNRNRSPEPGIR